MSGYSKEQIDELIRNIDIPSSSVYDVALINEDAPFVAEDKKLYGINNPGSWENDLEITLPNVETDDIEIGFSFEVFAAYMLNGKAVLIASSRPYDTWFGDEVFTESAMLPYPLDMEGQYIRITYVGVVPPELTGGLLVALWAVQRLDNQLGDVRIAALATTDPLPSYIASGEYSTRKLTATALSGTLSVDGKEITEAGVKYSILVKDELDSAKNGIYYPTKIGGPDPEDGSWELRRRSDFVFDAQIDVVGVAALITHGVTNGGKTFFLDPIDAEPNVEGAKTFYEAASGGSGGASLLLTDLKTDEYAGAVGEMVRYSPDSFTGNKRITFPAAPVNGDEFGIKNSTSYTDIINAYSAAHQIEDPFTGGWNGTNVPIGIPFIAIRWQYRDGYWYIVG